MARERFAKLRSDVLVKLELLDQKHGNWKICIINNISIRDMTTVSFSTEYTYEDCYEKIASLNPAPSIKDLF